MDPLDLVHDRVVLLAFRAEDEVVAIVADNGLVGGDYEHVQLVDLVELGLLGLRGTRHAGELVVHAEVVLDGDRGERLRLAMDLDSLLRFHRLMKPVAPPPPRHLTTRELVDDDDLAALADDVLLIPVEERVRLQELVDDVDLLALGRILRLELPHPLPLLLDRERLAVLDYAHLGGEIGHRKRLGIIR